MVYVFRISSAYAHTSFLPHVPSARFFRTLYNVPWYKCPTYAHFSRRPPAQRIRTNIRTSNLALFRHRNYTTKIFVLTKTKIYIVLKLSSFQHRKITTKIFVFLATKNLHRLPNTVKLTKKIFVLSAPRKIHRTKCHLSSAIKSTMKIFVLSVPRKLTAPF
jgi:hypothetical protein